MRRRLAIRLVLAVAAAATFAGALYADSLGWTIALGGVGVVLAGAAGAAMRSDLPGTQTGELSRFTSTFRGF
jgi:hypothetical protein